MDSFIPSVPEVVLHMPCLQLQAACSSVSYSSVSKDAIVLTENETEWVAIIEELQKAIRSKQMTQVGQACCGSRLLCGTRALLAALNYLLYVLTLVY